MIEFGKRFNEESVGKQDSCFPVNCGDEIDFGQREDSNLGETIEQTLQVLEMTGGPNAYLHIKYIVPVYESCVMYQY